MSIEETALDRVATNLALIAGAISTLAEAVNGTYAGKPIYGQPAAAPASTPAATTPTRRGRGRPVTGETAAPAAIAAPAASPAVAEDPFATAAPAPAAPTATLDQVRAALTALKDATSQDNALKVLKEAGGVSNLTDLQKTPEKYGAVVLAATAALPQPATEADPFETETATESEQKAPSLEDVKAAVVEAQKRTATGKVQAVVMKHGGVAAGANGNGPSLKALPIAAYAAVIAEVKALPTTK
jgi:hypothetical protein